MVGIARVIGSTIGKAIYHSSVQIIITTSVVSDT